MYLPGEATVQPIGYWVKEIDRMLEESFVRLLAEEGLTRRHWQVLNTLASGAVGQAEVDRALAPFLTAEAPSTAPVVEDLIARGWVGRPARLTEQGRVAHARLTERVSASRRAIIDGISDEEYTAAVNVLERMAGNLVRQFENSAG